MQSYPNFNRCSFCGHDGDSPSDGAYPCPRCGRLLPDVTDQLGEFVDDEIALSTIAESVARRLQILPISWSDVEITLASDLSQPEFVDKLGFIVARRVRLHYAETTALMQAIRASYEEGAG